MPPDPVVEEQKAKELKIKKVKICPWAETYCKSGASGGGGGPDQTRKKWRTPSLLTKRPKSDTTRVAKLQVSNLSEGIFASLAGTHFWSHNSIFVTLKSHCNVLLGDENKIRILLPCEYPSGQVCQLSCDVQIVEKARRTRSVLHEEIWAVRFDLIVVVWFQYIFSTILSMDPRVERQREKKKKYPFKCSLCKRRYEKHEHLYDHQGTGWFTEHFRKKNVTK